MAHGGTHYRVGKVFLAGSAAHVHPPTKVGRVKYQHRDAYSTGWKMAEALACGAQEEELLDSYEQERRPVAESLLRNFLPVT